MCLTSHTFLGNEEFSINCPNCLETVNVKANQLNNNIICPSCCKIINLKIDDTEDSITEE
ncbi:Zn finger protein HypA/HybF involved in hydrogenase expression [Eubacterium multiforme]|uniref:Zn finger protein HypA/HybF involved in hydrogenase expression n=1 Tax=Eubacterium multiforme TaxID=83339 RepID=A0ABT9US78_9FIRM|nr:Zn finger protein HypA/HybF involved in hydrogenase expression [Eubacterium multiforme]